MYMENINLPIPAELLAAVDGAREDVARTVWIRRAIEERLVAADLQAENDRLNRVYAKAKLDRDKMERKLLDAQIKEQRRSA
jgi:metal-responsive CopG/Arc/MetJ family transcriptional regulator